MRETKLLFTFDRLPPSLNEWQRMHWAQRDKVKEAWGWHVLAQAQELGLDRNQPIRRCTAVWHVKNDQYMDWDNLNGAFKALGDALVETGVLIDDSVAVIVEWTARFSKVKTRKEVGCEFEITPLANDEPLPAAVLGHVSAREKALKNKASRII